MWPKSNMQIFTFFAATLKGNVNKTLGVDLINEIFQTLREWAHDWQARAEAAPPCHPTLWKAN